MPGPSSFDVLLVDAWMVAPGVRHLVFERADGEKVEFAPGQWVNLVMGVGAGEEIKRSYSIASAPGAVAGFELAVTRVVGGPGSEFLHALPVGGRVRAIGPHGLFTREAGDGPPALFVATGTGVAPFRSMVRAAVGAGATGPLWLLFGGRFEEDILYRKEFEALARERAHVRYEVTLSRPGASWAGRSGYVQAHVPEVLGELSARCAAEGLGAPHVFVCGLDRMVSAVKDLCRNQLGVDRKRVHVERYD